MGDLSSLEETLLTVLKGHELYGLEIVKAIEEATEGKRKNRNKRARVARRVNCI